MDLKNLSLDDIAALAEGGEAEFLLALQTLLADESISNPLISFLLGARFTAAKRKEILDE